MITLNEFSEKITGLELGQELGVYVDGDTSPVMRFKKCKEFGSEFILAYSEQNMAFFIAQDAGLFTVEDTIQGAYEELVAEADEIVLV